MPTKILPSAGTILGNSYYNCEMTEPKPEDLHKFDYLLIITVAALLIVGLMMIYSATFALGYQLHDRPTYYFIRQLLWVGLGLLALIIFCPD